MQPNNNDPTSQNGQVPSPGQTVSPQTPGVPAWQQGFGASAAPTQPVPPASPATPNPSTPVLSHPVYGATPDAGMGASMPGPKRGVSKLLIATVAVVVVLAAAVAGYLVLAKGSTHQSATNAAQTSANNATKAATQLGTLTSATLAAPKDMTGFQNDVGTGPDHDFLTTGSNSTVGGCELAFGTDSATALPGATIDDIVTPGIQALQKNGVTVNGPDAGTALILKDAAGTQYSLPTISYSFTQGTKNATTIYSIAITKDGNRTYVRRSCAVNGPLDSAKLSMLAQKASQLTVTAH